MRLTFVKGITNVHLSINRIKIDLVLILIGICPIFFLSDNLNPLEVLRNQRIAFFLVASLLIIATCHANKFIGAFLLLSVAHLFMFPSVDYFEVKMKFLICGALVYHFVHQNYRGEKYKYVLLAVTALTVFIGSLQFFLKDIFFYAKMETPGMMILPSYMGQFCAIVAPVIAMIHPVLLIIPILGLALSKSIVSIVAFCVSMLFFFYFKSRSLFIVLLALVILTLPFLAKKDFDSGQWHRRLTVWKMVSSKAFRSPFVGYGIGNYGQSLFMEWNYAGKDGKNVFRWFQANLKDENVAVINAKIREIAEEGGFDTSRLDVHNTLLHKMDEMRGKGLNSYIWDHPHNEYLLIWYEYGILGLLIVLCFIGDIFRRFFVLTSLIYQEFDTSLYPLMASFVAVLLLSTVHFTLHLPITIPVAIVLIAILDKKLN